MRLDATGSGAAATFAWEQTAGAAVQLDGVDTATPRFTAPAAGTELAFRVTARRPGGEPTDSDTADVSVTVEANTPPVARIAGGGTLPVGTPVTLDGSASAGAATFSWTVDPPVDVRGADQPVATLEMPDVPAEVTLTVDGSGGDPDTTSVGLVPEPDNLSPDQPQFRTRRGQWRLSGTTSATLPNTVTAYLGTDTTDQAARIGSAVCDAARAFDIRTAVAPGQLALRPGTGALVTFISSRGGRTVDQVEIRD